ncbi:MAG: hypothetical protein VCB99_12655 [Myxococcota bacterium]
MKQSEPLGRRALPDSQLALVSVSLSGSFAPREKRVDEWSHTPSLAPGDCFFDVGPSMGLYSASGACQVGEPFGRQATSLDRHLAESGCALPALIMIGIEGFEFPALQGADSLLSDRETPLVVFVTHNDPSEVHAAWVAAGNLLVGEHR